MKKIRQNVCYLVATEVKFLVAKEED
jgi:hypothetical protein